MGKVGAKCLTVDTARFRIDSGLESMIVLVTEGFLMQIFCVLRPMIAGDDSKLHCVAYTRQ